MEGRSSPDRRPAVAPPPAAMSRGLQELTFLVPDGFILVETRATPGAAAGWLLVERRGVLGQAWAQSWPIRSRRLLRLRNPPGATCPC